MPARYDERPLYNNSNDLYQSFLRERNINKIRQYNTLSLHYPTEEQIGQLNFATHTWSKTDKLWRLSQKLYGSPDYHWVIAFFNKKGSELEFIAGDTVFIPQPLNTVLYFITE